MNFTYIIVILSCLITSCNTCQKEKVGKSDKYIVENRISKDTIEVLKLSFSEKNYPMFFKYFPSSYRQFLDIYGFDDKKGAKPLYNVYESHINYFFEYEGRIEKLQFAKKVYEISKNGIWEADAPTILQDNLTRLILNQPQVILSLLTTKSEKETESFWFFVFDGSTKNDLQNKKKYETVYEKVKTLNPRQAEILRLTFEKMYK